MRIENNNISFGAYFKENSLLKKVYSSNRNNVNKKLLDTFTKKCPNHEVEILELDRSVPAYAICRLFNNTNHQSIAVRFAFACDGINKILQDLTKNEEFWGPIDSCYQQLIGKNK